MFRSNSVTIPAWVASQSWSPGAAIDPPSAPLHMKPLGVRSAMLAIRAERLGPEAIFIPPSHIQSKGSDSKFGA